VINIDTTGLDALEALHKTLARRGGRLLLVDLNEQPASLLNRSGLMNEIGLQNVFDDLEHALEVAAIPAAADAARVFAQSEAQS
jgi:SulP family sulfate permease